MIRRCGLVAVVALLAGVLTCAHAASFTADIIDNYYLQNKSYCMLSLNPPAKARCSAAPCTRHLLTG
jgi:hypothetical protein